MTTDTASPSERPVSRAQLATLRQRVALHDVAEMVVLRQRAVLVAAAVVMVVGLVLALLAPSVLPGNALTGLLVGLLALAAGLAAAFVVHRQDPVLRSRMQARWDGSSVLAWVSSLEDGRAAEPAVLELLGRVRSDRVHRRLFVEGGGGAREAADVVAHEAAIAGRSVLLVDLTDDRDAVGIAGVVEDGVRLSDVVEFEQGMQLARVGVGRRLGDAVEVTVAQLERDRSDLDMMLVVAPSELELRRPLLRAVDTATLVVAANARQRRSVHEAVLELETTAETTDLLLVGGHLTAVDPIPAGMSRWAGDDRRGGAGGGRTNGMTVAGDEDPPDGGRPAAPPPSTAVGDAPRPGVAPPAEPPTTPPAASSAPPAAAAAAAVTPSAAAGGVVDDGARDAAAPDHAAPEVATNEVASDDAPPDDEAADTPDAVAPASTDATADIEPADDEGDVRHGDSTPPQDDWRAGGSWQGRPFRADDVAATSDPAPGESSVDPGDTTVAGVAKDVTEVIELDGSDDLVTSTTLESLHTDGDDQA